MQSSMHADALQSSSFKVCQYIQGWEELRAGSMIVLTLYNISALIMHNALLAILAKTNANLIMINQFYCTIKR